MTFSEKLKHVADTIEELRLEIFQNLKVDAKYEDDVKDKKELDDALFKIQSDMRYELATIAEYLE